MSPQLAQQARIEINSSNWHFIRETEDINLLVSVILDFIQVTASIFSSQDQISYLCDQIETQIDGQQLKSQGGLQQYHLGIVILLADFVHLLYDSSPDKCLKIC